MLENRPSGGASDFLQNRPPQASQLPSERPGVGEGPSERPGMGEGPGQRPGVGERPTERPQPGEGPASENRPDRIDDRQNSQQDRMDNRTDQRDDRQDSASERRDDQIDNRQDHRDNLTDNRVDRIDNMDQQRTDRVERRVEVRDQVRQNPPRNDFWNTNRYAGRWTRPYRGATWGAVAGWFPWGWTQPVSYNYGDNVYVQDDSVYYGDNAVATQQEYGQQAFAIASSADEVAPDDSAGDTEWMSLGVFALTQDGQASGPAPNLFVQLAVSKEGMIAGTYFNNSTDQSQEIAGVVDKKTQRTAWTVGPKEWPVMETGISGLTEDEAPALIHFADGQTQKWLMVRLEESESDASQQTNLNAILHRHVVVSSPKR